MRIVENTSYVLTELVVIPALVVQGDLFSPLQARVQDDSRTRKLGDQDLAREWLKESWPLFKCKDRVSIPRQGLMDYNA